MSRAGHVTGGANAKAERLLEIRDLKVQYANGALGVEQISLQVAAGTIVALIGPNGAGKSTIARSVSGFLRTEGVRAVGGEIILDGENVTNREPHHMSRRGVALVPERRKVFMNLSVKDNLAALGRAPSADAIDRVYELFPVLVARRAQMAGRLSGGQQQMLGLARAIVRNPRLLVVDELTLGLHRSMHRPLFDALEKISGQGTSVLVIDESAGFALRIAQYCYLIQDGHIKSSGVAERFRHGDEIAAAYET